jgi:hypothetical protein
LRYSADITAGALKVPESRVIAGLLLGEADEAKWHQAIFDENVLQARRPATAKRLRTLLRNRLSSMPRAFWELIREGSGDTSTHACLACAVKHSALLGDFMDLVMRDQYRLYAESLSHSLWTRYIEECRGRDPDMPVWSDSTIRRLRSSVFQILSDAGYLDSTRSMKLQTVHIAQPVIHLLQQHNEDDVLRCIQVAP